MMPTDRRRFIRDIAIGSSAIAGSLPARSATATASEPAFNMCGYAAPRIDRVRIGFIGLGMRGPGAVERMSHIDGVEIKALCDKLPERADKANRILEKAGLPKADTYSGEEGWKALCERKDLDLVYICTPWHLHTPMAVYAMRSGKHAATEVPAAQTLEECWQLVETSEKTRRHCMMLENCCYDFFELLTLNMARNGLFGSLLHAEGAYIHDLGRDYLFNKGGYNDMWRLKANMGRQGNLYPTHGLGPIAQCLDIGRGDRMDYLVSMTTADLTLSPLADEMAAKDDFFKPFTGKSYHGNMNNTTIRTVKGRTMLLQHDIASPRPYSRIHLLSGTKGMASKWPSPQRIAFGHAWLKDEEMKAMEEKYTPPIVKHIGEIAKSVGGHGGMDFIMDWRLIDCLRNGLPLDQDVYDAAAWSCIVPLSDASAKARAKSMDIPDFTRGAWKTNKPHDMTLNGGGNTGVR